MANRGKVALLLLLTLGMLSCSRQEEEFPNRPVLLICPWTAGGGTDRVARQLAVGLERELGVPVNVVNATGASGVTGHTRGALARPDGYTITLATAELNLLHWRGLTPVTYKDFRPGALLNRDPAALFVRKDAPWESLTELSAHIRENPRDLQASGTALGGIWHVALAGWLHSMGLAVDAVRWISIEGSTPSLQELMAGGLDMVSCSLPEARSLLEAGEIRSLGVMAEHRLEQFPEVPTFREQGMEVTLGTWRGIVLPLDVPEYRVQVLQSALEKVVKGDEFRTFMRRAGFNWAYEEEEAFLETLVRLDREFGEVLTGEAFSSIGEGIVGPMAFPAVLGILGVAVLLTLLVTRQLRLSEEAVAFSREGMVRTIEVLGCILLYLLAAEQAGFVLTAMVLVLYQMWRLGIRWRISLPVSFLVVIGIYHVFAVLLRVPLPRGIFGW